jgi:hypothetical protein
MSVIPATQRQRLRSVLYKASPDKQLARPYLKKQTSHVGVCLFAGDIGRRIVVHGHENLFEK